MDVLEKSSKEYSGYFTLDLSLEEANIEDEIEEMLMHLDEYASLLKSLENYTDEVFVSALGDISSKHKEMKVIFQKIDDLERFVAVVKRNMQTLSDQVSEAENHLGTMKPFLKVFSSIPNLFGKSSPTSVTEFKFTNPVIFNPDDFFRNEPT